MKFIKDLPAERNAKGKLRQMVLVGCVSCGTTKKVRKDIKQTTPMCNPCAQKTHGDTKTRLYNIYYNMRARCYNAAHNRYQYYGAKGVVICDAWATYYQFKQWAIGAGYAEHLSIDRIDPTGNYKPSNCRWVDATVQAINRRMPVGASGFAGVTCTYVAEVRAYKKLIYRVSARSPEEAALLREEFIVSNQLEHQRNFPELALKEIRSALEAFNTQISN